MHFVMKLSKLCNLRCSYCYEYDELGDRGRMPLDRLDWFFASLAEHYVAAGWRFKLSFVFHGGEPLLLPERYLRALVAAMHHRLGAANVPFSMSMQTNLTRLTDRTIDLLDELRIALGVSIDVYGGQRLTIAGEDAQDRALDNLQRLFDRDAVRRLGVGGISVLHGRNVDRAVDTFEFYRELGLDYRILPVFSITDPPPRMHGLTLTADRVVAAMQQVALAQLRAAPVDPGVPARQLLRIGGPSPRGGGVPSLRPARRRMGADRRHRRRRVQPRRGVLARGTDGQHLPRPLRRHPRVAGPRGDAGPARGPGRDLRRVPVPRRVLRHPGDRGAAVRAHHSLAGHLECTVARPMIAFMTELLRADQVAAGRIAEFVAERGAERVA
jgi:molybdenum cofactor biosynthesis enzyme MoaA